MSELNKEAVQDTAQEVATDSQSQEPEISPELGSAIAESKKYRNRAQEAETKLAEYQSKVSKQEDERLAKQNEWKEIAEKRQAHIDSMETDYNRLKGAEEAYREELLNSLSDEDKESFGDLSVEQLRTLTDKLNKEINSVAPTSGAPARSTNPTNKNWVDMSAEERRDNWGDILQGYAKR
jgi:small-conductance mechanosensitive channel|tara:strand:+ start:194 stop:733 length:540 start_codon:yes stop_codon:yes gene_type:complete